MTAETDTTSTPCPTCGSQKVYSYGHRYRKDGSKTQRFKCPQCGLSFSENYKRLSLTKEDRQIGAGMVENLTNATETKTVAVDEKSLNGKIIEYLCKMKRQGYAEATRRLASSCLRILMERGAHLAEPESVKETIATQQWSPCRRRNIINAYTQFLKFLGLSWEPPINNIVRKIPFIPTEEEIDDLIAGNPNTVATMLQLLKETAMRSGEAIRLKWKDVDFQRKIIMLNEPEKGSNPRIFNNLSGKLLTMLNQMPRTNEFVFGERTINSLKATYTRARKRLAFKLGNPRLREIHFHTLRHWKATMEYHYTKDILHVKEFLGHKEIDNTQLYIQLDKQLFQNVPEENFTIRTVSTLEEAVKLGEIGFEPFMVINGVQLMRKRK
jgi:integrase/predicted RNA-binding Zn-ribbon protein involved in translation (DUF1610 family)